MASIEGNGGRDPSHSKDEKQKYDNVLNYIADRVREHKCVLFLGSAIHAETPEQSIYEYPGKHPLIGKKLSQHLAGISGYEGSDKENLQRVSWHYEVTYGFRKQLIDEVRKAVHDDCEPSPILRGLAQLGFPLVITTNYDQLYEQALLQVAKGEARAAGQSEAEIEKLEEPFVRCIYDPDTVKTRDCDVDPDFQKPYILKIHGDISKNDSLVITDEDYIHFVMRMTDRPKHKPVGEQLLKHLNQWSTLFIGYSFKDYNLRLLFKSLRWRLDVADLPSTYSVDLAPDVLIMHVWQNRSGYVQFIEKNLWDFVPDLYEKVTGKKMPQ